MRLFLTRTFMTIYFIEFLKGIMPVSYTHLFFMLFANYLTGSSDMGGLEFTQSQKGILMGVGTGILYFLPVLTLSLIHI